MNDVKTNGYGTFSLPHDMIVVNVGEVRRRFLDAPSDGRLTLDAGDIGRIDVSGIQLIVALIGEGLPPDQPRLAALSPAAAQAFARAGITLPPPTEPKSAG